MNFISVEICAVSRSSHCQSIEISYFWALSKARRAFNFHSHRIYLFIVNKLVWACQTEKCIDETNHWLTKSRGILEA